MVAGALVVKSLFEAMGLLPQWEVASTEDGVLLPDNDVG